MSIQEHRLSPCYAQLKYKTGILPKGYIFVPWSATLRPGQGIDLDAHRTDPPWIVRRLASILSRRFTLTLLLSPDTLSASTHLRGDAHPCD